MPSKRQTGMLFIKKAECTVSQMQEQNGQNQTIQMKMGEVNFWSEAYFLFEICRVEGSAIPYENY
jgi:hypothetical protein